MMAYATGGKRNVIVLGKSGCGKSTLANKIVCSSEEDDEGENGKDAEPFKVAQSFQAVTAKVESTITNVVIGSQTYPINMIDTIGFCDTRSSGALSDKKIMLQIKKHMRERAAEGLSLIIFVFRRGRFTEEEKSVFQLISKHFTEYIKDISCLVITGCDGMNEKARNELVLNFKTDPLTAKFAKIMTKGIFTVGLPRISTLSKRAKTDAIEDMTDDLAPIHKIIAEAKLFYLHKELQKEIFWEKLSVCTIL